MHNVSYTYILLILLLLSTAACTKKDFDIFQAQSGTKSRGKLVQLPEKDSTPPIVIMKIPDLGSGPIALHPGDKTLEIHANTASSKKFFIEAVGEDPQGIKSVCLSYGYFAKCCKDSMCSEENHLSPLEACKTIEAEAGKRVEIGMSFHVPVDFAKIGSCQSGWEGEHRMVVTGKAKNFAGSEVLTPTAVFINP